MCFAPPSLRSSRATMVTTAYSSCIRLTASAMRLGSSMSTSLGFLVSIKQKPQALVQRSPKAIKVAVPWFQHSKMLGQPASSQTVVKSRRLIVCFNFRYSGPKLALTFILSGFRPIGRSLFSSDFLVI